MTPDNNSKFGSSWERRELVLALYLYCQVPFSKTTSTNPEIIRLAKLIGRTPSSVARKLGNFGAMDPTLAKRGIRGLTHFSKADKMIWEDFYSNWDSLVDESSEILSAMKSVGPIEATSRKDLEEKIIVRPVRETEKRRVVTARLYQPFFRRTVMASYESSCCICRLDIPKLLIASHIIPWSINKMTRTDPHNGLCLCALHDKAFDTGLIAVDSSLRVRLSSSIKQSKSPLISTVFLAFQDHPIKLPKRFQPKQEYLDWHFHQIFAT